MKTCTIKARCSLYDETLAEKQWTGVDIMHIGHTKGWCTRQLNIRPQEHIKIWWECRHDQPAEKGSDYCCRFEGTIVRVQGSLLKSGYFE